MSKRTLYYINIGTLPCQEHTDNSIKECDNIHKNLLVVDGYQRWSKTRDIKNKIFCIIFRDEKKTKKKEKN